MTTKPRQVRREAMVMVMVVLGNTVSAGDAATHTILYDPPANGAPPGDIMHLILQSQKPRFRGRNAGHVFSFIRHDGAPHHSALGGVPLNPQTSAGDQISAGDQTSAGDQIPAGNQVSAGDPTQTQTSAGDPPQTQTSAGDLPNIQSVNDDLAGTLTSCSDCLGNQTLVGDLPDNKTSAGDISDAGTSADDLLRTETPANDLHETEATTDVPPGGQIFSGESSEAHTSLDGVLDTQTSSSDLRDTQTPSSDLLVNKTSSSGLQDTQAPSSDLGDTQTPFSDLLVNKTSSSGLQDTQAPSSDLGDTQTPFSGPQDRQTSANDSDTESSASKPPETHTLLNDVPVTRTFARDLLDTEVSVDDLSDTKRSPSIFLDIQKTDRDLPDISSSTYDQTYFQNADRFPSNVYYIKNNHPDTRTSVDKGGNLASGPLLLTTEIFDPSTTLGEFHETEGLLQTSTTLPPAADAPAEEVEAIPPTTHGASEIMKGKDKETKNIRKKSKVKKESVDHIQNTLYFAFEKDKRKAESPPDVPLGKSVDSRVHSLVDNPAEHRSDQNNIYQYHFQDHQEGSYKFGYGDPNQWRHEQRRPDGVVLGRYGWFDATGKEHVTYYVSDAKGYRVVAPGEKITIHIPDPSITTATQRPTVPTPYTNPPPTAIAYFALKTSAPTDPPLTTVGTPSLMTSTATDPPTATIVPPSEMTPVPTIPSLTPGQPMSLSSSQQQKQQEPVSLSSSQQQQQQQEPVSLSSSQQQEPVSLSSSQQQQQQEPVSLSSSQQQQQQEPVSLSSSQQRQQQEPVSLSSSQQQQQQEPVSLSSSQQQQQQEPVSLSSSQQQQQQEPVSLSSSQQQQPESYPGSPEDLVRPPQAPPSSVFMGRPPIAYPLPQRQPPATKRPDTWLSLAPTLSPNHLWSRPRPGRPSNRPIPSPFRPVNQPRPLLYRPPKPLKPLLSYITRPRPKPVKPTTLDKAPSRAPPTRDETLKPGSSETITDSSEYVQQYSPKKPLQSDKPTKAPYRPINRPQPHPVRLRPPPPPPASDEVGGPPSEGPPLATTTVASDSDQDEASELEPANLTDNLVSHQENMALSTGHATHNLRPLVVRPKPGSSHLGRPLLPAPATFLTPPGMGIDTNRPQDNRPASPPSSLSGVVGPPQPQSSPSQSVEHIVNHGGQTPGQKYPLDYAFMDDDYNVLAEGSAVPGNSDDKVQVQQSAEQTVDDLKGQTATIDDSVTTVASDSDSQRVEADDPSEADTSTDPSTGTTDLSPGFNQDPGALRDHVFLTTTDVTTSDDDGGPQYTTTNMEIGSPTTEDSSSEAPPYTTSTLRDSPTTDVTWPSLFQETSTLAQTESPTSPLPSQGFWTELLQKLYNLPNLVPQIRRQTIQ